MGLLHVYLTAHANSFMEFPLFFFQAEMGIYVGVEFDFGLVFISIYISVHLDADLCGVRR
jgi:hypothetical protein